MQAAKKAAESIKETAANIGASAKSGLEKTKATVQEKTEKMTAHDPIQKDMATEKKEERISQAELEKQEAREHNSTAKEAATAGNMTGADGRYTTTGSGPRTPTKSAASEHGQTMWADQMSTMPQQHGLGQSATAIHMGGQYTTTEPRATYSPTGEHGTGQPMKANQMSSMAEQHGLGHRLGQSATAAHMEGQYSPTGLSATYSTTGEHGQGQPMRGNQMSSMPEQHGLGHRLEQSGTATGTRMVDQYTTTGPGATYSPTGELGQGQPIRGNQMSSMPGQQEHGLGHGLGELADEMMVGSNPAGTNTGTGRTRAHNTHVGGTAPAPAPAPESGPAFR